MGRYDNDPVVSGGIAKDRLMGAIVQAVAEQTEQKEAKDAEQIAELMAVERSGYWPWSPKYRFTEEQAREFLEGLWSHCRKSYHERIRLARLKTLKQIASAAHIEDVRLPEDDILLLRPYLGSWRSGEA